MSEILDSSEKFNQRNYKGKIREVVLSKTLKSTHTLEEVIKIAREEGHFLDGIAILNIVHGDPDENEPTEAILLKKRDVVGEGYSGMIIGRYFGERTIYQLYSKPGSFRFIS